MRSNLGVKYNLMLAPRRQIFEYLRDLFYKHALEYPQSARSEKKGKKTVFLRKSLTTIDLIASLWSVGILFRQF